MRTTVVDLLWAAVTISEDRHYWKTSKCFHDEFGNPEAKTILLRDGGWEGAPTYSSVLRSGFDLSPCCLLTILHY